MRSKTRRIVFFGRAHRRRKAGRASRVEGRSRGLARGRPAWGQASKAKRGARNTCHASRRASLRRVAWRAGTRPVKHPIRPRQRPAVKRARPGVKPPRPAWGQASKASAQPGAARELRPRLLELRPGRAEALRAPLAALPPRLALAWRMLPPPTADVRELRVRARAGEQREQRLERANALGA